MAQVIVAMVAPSATFHPLLLLRILFVVPAPSWMVSDVPSFANSASAASPFHDEHNIAWESKQTSISKSLSAKPITEN